MANERYKFTKEDGIKILKALGYSALSAVVLTAIQLISDIDVPEKYVFIVPIINTILVVLKRFFSK